MSVECNQNKLQWLTPGIFVRNIELALLVCIFNIRHGNSIWLQLNFARSRIWKKRWILARAGLQCNPKYNNEGNKVVKNKIISTNTKLRMISALIWTVMSYRSEAWNLCRKKDEYNHIKIYIHEKMLQVYWAHDMIVCWHQFFPHVCSLQFIIFMWSVFFSFVIHIQK